MFPSHDLVVHGRYKTVDTMLDIPRNELVNKAQLPWFKSFPGTPDKQFETQGNMYYVADASLSLICMIDYEIEFQSWVLPANSPASGQLSTSNSKQPPSGKVDKNSDLVIIDGMTYKRSSA